MTACPVLVADGQGWQLVGTEGEEGVVVDELLVEVELEAEVDELAPESFVAVGRLSLGSGVELPLLLIVDGELLPALAVGVSDGCDKLTVLVTALLCDESVLCCTVGV